MSVVQLCLSSKSSPVSQSSFFMGQRPLRVTDGFWLLGRKCWSVKRVRFTISKKHKRLRTLLTTPRIKFKFPRLMTRTYIIRAKTESWSQTLSALFSFFLLLKKKQKKLENTISPVFPQPHKTISDKSKKCFESIIAVSLCRDWYGLHKNQIIIFLSPRYVLWSWFPEDILGTQKEISNLENWPQWQQRLQRMKQPQKYAAVPNAYLTA